MGEFAKIAFSPFFIRLLFPILVTRGLLTPFFDSAVVLDLERQIGSGCNNGFRFLWLGKTLELPFSAFFTPFSIRENERNALQNEESVGKFSEGERKEEKKEGRASPQFLPPLHRDEMVHASLNAGKKGRIYPP